MSKTFEDIFAETLLGRIKERDSSIKLSVDDLESEFDKGVRSERERIIKYFDRTYDWNESVEFDRDELIAIIEGDCK
jgi:hypothetical protein